MKWPWIFWWFLVSWAMSMIMAPVFVQCPGWVISKNMATARIQKTRTTSVQASSPTITMTPPFIWNIPNLGLRKSDNPIEFKSEKIIQVSNQESNVLKSVTFWIWVLFFVIIVSFILLAFYFINYLHKHDISGTLIPSFASILFPSLRKDSRIKTDSQKLECYYKQLSAFNPNHLKKMDPLFPRSISFSDKSVSLNEESTISSITDTSTTSLRNLGNSQRSSRQISSPLDLGHNPLTYYNSFKTGFLMMQRESKHLSGIKSRTEPKSFQMKTNKPISKRTPPKKQSKLEPIP